MDYSHKNKFKGTSYFKDPSYLSLKAHYILKTSGIESVQKKISGESVWHQHK